MRIRIPFLLFAYTTCLACIFLFHGISLSQVVCSSARWLGCPVSLSPIPCSSSDQHWLPQQMHEPLLEITTAIGVSCTASMISPIRKAFGWNVDSFAIRFCFYDSGWITTTCYSSNNSRANFQSITFIMTTGAPFWWWWWCRRRASIDWVCLAMYRPLGPIKKGEQQGDQTFFSLKPKKTRVEPLVKMAR